MVKAEYFLKMTNKIRSCVLLIVIVLGQYSCDIMDSQRLYVFNDTNDTLFCFWDTNAHSHWTGNNPLNGTMEIVGKDTTWSEWNSLLFPNSKSQFSDYDWKHTINNSKTQKLYINFYLVSSFNPKDKFMIEKVKPDTILSYTFGELEKNNWQVHLKDK